MTDPFTKQFADLFKAGSYGQLPEQMQAMFHDGLAKSREAAMKSLEVAKDGAMALSQANTLASKEATALTSKAFEHAAANAEAAFTVARSLASAKSPAQVAELQVSFMQSQLTKAGAQGKELLELSTKLAQKTAEATAQLATSAAKA